MFRACFSLSVLHINIRSLKKNFENFKNMLHELKFEFKVICVTETWCKDKNISTNSNFQIPNYTVNHQLRATAQAGGGTCMFIHNSLTYKKRDDLCKNDADCESQCIEIEPPKISLLTLYTGHLLGSTRINIGTTTFLI